MGFLDRCVSISVLECFGRCYGLSWGVSFLECFGCVLYLFSGVDVAMALSSEYFLVSRVRIRGCKCGNFTNWCKIGSEKNVGAILSRGHSACALLLQYSWNRTKGFGGKGLGQRGILVEYVFFSWLVILCFYFACSGFLCVR